MKKSVALLLLLFVVGVFAIPAFADEAKPDEAKKPNMMDNTMKNAAVGGRNISTGWVEVLDSTHEEASKGKGTGEQLTGVAVGGVIGIRKTLHRAGAGAIDLLTF